MSEIGAVILAAGLSSRMGQPKMALPWRDTTVIGQVARVLSQAGARPVVAVTGAEPALVGAAFMAALPDPDAGILALNPDYANGEMLLSLQAGVRALPETAEACLVALGDQPQIEPEVVSLILSSYRQDGGILLVPSVHMRRGHPWLIHRALWPDLLGLASPSTPRDFLNRHAGEIRYMNVERESILADLDTPEEYEKARRGKDGR